MMERYKGYWISGSGRSWPALYSLLGNARNGPERRIWRQQNLDTLGQRADIAAEEI